MPTNYKECEEEILKIDDIKKLGELSNKYYKKKIWFGIACGIFSTIALVSLFEGIRMGTEEFSNFIKIIFGFATGYTGGLCTGLFCSVNRDLEKLADNKIKILTYRGDKNEKRD